MAQTTARKMTLSQTEAMATIAAMRTSDDLKAALRRQWIANSPGARFSVLGAYRRQNGQR